MYSVVYDTAVENVFPVSGTVKHIYIVMEHLTLYHGVKELADNMGGVFLKVVPSQGG